MKNKLKIPIIFLIISLIFISVFSVSVGALSWDGSSAGGGGGGTYTTKKGFVLRTTYDNCLGYRFSVVDKSGNNKVSKVIDVFRNTKYGNSCYTNSYKFTVKYNKKQFIDNQNSGFSTSLNTVNCYKETDMDFASSLPAVTGIETWQANHNNLNKVLSKLGIGSVDDLRNGDMVLVEPFYDVQLEAVFHAVTTTELAIYGKYLLGVNSNGAVGTTSSTWGYIANYTNMHYPNYLYTPDGQGLWQGVSKLTSKATFYNIINKGYGVGIAYTETKPDTEPNLNVEKCEVFKGDKGTRNYSFGVSSGSSFANWICNEGYPINRDKVWFSVNFPDDGENSYVKQTVTIEGLGTYGQNVYSNDGIWYDVQFNPSTVDANASEFLVKAREDWIDLNGTVLKYGVEKTFYIPVQPDVKGTSVEAQAIDGYIMAIADEQNEIARDSVYLGQTLYHTYSYESNNDWLSQNDILVDIFRYKGYYFDDFREYHSDENVAISADRPYFADVNYYIVEKYENDNYLIRHDLTNIWENDLANTWVTQSYYIPISIPDVAVTDILLYDRYGYYIGEDDVPTNEGIVPQYEVTNFDDVRVYAVCYDDDGTGVGCYAIDPGESIYIDGREFYISDPCNFTIEGSVYLEGYKNDTSCESNGDNNRMVKTFKARNPVYIHPLEPNACYREGTDVISTFFIENSSDKSFTDNISVEISVENRDTGEEYFCKEIEDIALPDWEVTIAFAKWTVPKGVKSGEVCVTANLYIDGEYYSNNCFYNNIIPYLSYDTEDTHYEAETPNNFILSEPAGEYVSASEWYIWKYSDGEFYTVWYDLCALIETAKLMPENEAPAKLENGTWLMKSGYGIKAEVKMFEIKGIPEDYYTLPQYVTARFPEFMYSDAKDKTAGLIYENNTFKFFKTSYGNCHFIPIWFPDGEYTVHFTASDCWTPMGHYSCAAQSEPIRILGSVYDDWYIGRE